MTATLTRSAGAPVAPPSARPSAAPDVPDVRAPSSRLRSLDVLRGIAIVGMILVNNEGSGAHAFPGMSHAAWNGWSPADLVFPLFLFVVGASMALSMAKRPPSLAKILRRGGLLFVIGLGMNALPPTIVHEVRTMGVLQRIGLAYVLASLLVRYASPKRQWQVGAAVLLGYWALVSLFPMRPDMSLPGLVDRFVLGPSHVYKNGWYDPEGLLSTLTATVSVLAGYWATTWLRRQERTVATVRRLAMAGLAAIVVGQVWNVVFPINKRLWTSSYVVLTAGWGLILLALCYLAVEVRGNRRHTWPLEVLGMNALAIFIGSEFVTNYVKMWGWRPWLYSHVFASWAGFLLGSLLYALATAAVWWVVAYGLWRRRWFIKV